MKANGLRIRFGERLRCACNTRRFLAYDIEISGHWLRAICRRCRYAFLVIELDD
jgi:hypothetical protein